MTQYFKRLVKFVCHGQPVVKNIVNAQIVTIQPNGLLKNKKILITGGSKGIGYAIAKRCVVEGAEVIITGRNENDLIRASSELHCHHVTMDIRNVDLIDDFFCAIDREHNGINYLINNAGVSLHEDGFCNVNIDGYDDQFATNVRGAYFLTQSFVKKVKARNQKGSKVIFLSSQRGIFVDDIPYGLTKASINSLVKGLAYNYIGDDIRVYGLAPGVTATQLIGEDYQDNLYYGINRTKRYYLPEEVAEIAVFLLSPVANCLSGNILVCDEGRSINSYNKF